MWMIVGTDWQKEGQFRDVGIEGEMDLSCVSLKRDYNMVNIKRTLMGSQVAAGRACLKGNKSLWVRTDLGTQLSGCESCFCLWLALRAWEPTDSCLCFSNLNWSYLNSLFLYLWNGGNISTCFLLCGLLKLTFVRAFSTVSGNMLNAI